MTTFVVLCVVRVVSTITVAIFAGLCSRIEALNQRVTDSHVDSLERAERAGEGHALVKLPALEAAKALADGRLDRAEAARLLRELNELISAALVIRTWCERALVEGVVTVDGGAR